MGKKITKESLIENLFLYRGTDSNADEYISKVEQYLKQEQDADLTLVLHTFKTYKADDDNESFENRCATAAPVFQLLESCKTWTYLEIHVLSTPVIMYHPSYGKTLELFNKAIDMISKKEYINEPKYQRIEAALRYNMTRRILDAKDFEPNLDTDALEDTFKQCYTYVMKIFEGKEHLLLRKYVLQVRRAILEKDCERLEDNLVKLIKLGDKHDNTYQETKAHAIKLIPRMGENLSKPLLNILIGHNIQIRRIEQSMTVATLAEALDAEPSTINAIERGAEGISIERLNKICHILKVSSAYLLGEHDQVQNVDPFLHNMDAVTSKLTKEQKKLILKSVKLTIQVSKSK